jgi:hypothetical protein
MLRWTDEDALVQGTMSDNFGDISHPRHCRDSVPTDIDKKAKLMTARGEAARRFS